MIILDTNVISEMMRPAPDPAVQAWLNRQAHNTVYLSVITIAEIDFGIACMPGGRRKEAMEWAASRVLERYEEMILPFNLKAAKRYAELATKARKDGRGFPMPDSYIAAIASAHQMIVATRDEAPYRAAGLKVINPWNE